MVALATMLNANKETDCIPDTALSVKLMGLDQKHLEQRAAELWHWLRRQMLCNL